MIAKYFKPPDLAAAASILASEPKAAPLAGGTFILTNAFKDKELVLVSVSGLLPRGLKREDAVGGWILEIGADTTFQELLESPLTPPVLRDAARGMANRNIRNRATVGGNLGANKSSGSLPPLLSVLDADMEMAETGRIERVAVKLPPPDQLYRVGGLIAKIRLPFEPKRRYAYRRWSRTACDLAILSAAVSFRADDAAKDKIRDARVAFGGLDCRTRRLPELEQALEGVSIRDRATIETVSAPFFVTIDDVRGGAGFKRYRLACLLADALAGAEAQP